MSYFTTITCDKCGRRIGWKIILTKTLAQRIARKEGWSIGKQTLCPKCRKPRKEKRRNE